MRCGAGSSDSATLASAPNAVAVSIQYRLGPWFLGGERVGTSKFGLTTLALRWARDNGGFGGDRNASWSSVCPLVVRQWRAGATAPPGLIFAAAMESPGGHRAGWRREPARPRLRGAERPRRGLSGHGGRRGVRSTMWAVCARCRTQTSLLPQRRAVRACVAESPTG